jgi:hypothetical protein
MEISAMKRPASISQVPVSVDTLAYADRHHPAVKVAGGDARLVTAIEAALAPVLARVWPSGACIEIEIYPHAATL